MHRDNIILIIVASSSMVYTVTYGNSTMIFW